MDLQQGAAEARIAIVGLGYVGLPLAVEFAKHFDVVGFDKDPRRVAEVRGGRDGTREVSRDDLAKAARLSYSEDPGALRASNVFIVAVPTPLDAAKRPDLGALIEATETVARVLKAGDLVVFESTVYPGCTEEVCVPILERVSGLRHDTGEAGGISAPPGSGAGFLVGYSPERINPGDTSHRLPDILKVTSGSSPAAAYLVDALYSRIVKAGTHKAPSIRVAEAAKVIENTQRDLNIALVNDLAILFNKLGIDTLDVLEAAGTKWNFLPFRPGLVGGHCIGVDPYYLTHKAEQVGHHPQVILAGRRTNDRMGSYVAGQVVRLMMRKAINPVQARILVLGLAFKENCPDVRNTRVVDIVSELRDCNALVDVFDPWVDPEEARREHGVSVVAELASGAYDAVVLAVAHDQFRVLGADGIRALCKPQSVVYDVKSMLPRHLVDGRL